MNHPEIQAKRINSVNTEIKQQTEMIIETNTEFKQTLNLNIKR